VLGSAYGVILAVLQADLSCVIVNAANLGLCGATAGAIVGAFTRLIDGTKPSPGEGGRCPGQGLRQPPRIAAALRARGRPLKDSAAQNVAAPGRPVPN
jgi:hypothetical protein